MPTGCGGNRSRLWWVSVVPVHEGTSEHRFLLLHSSSSPVRLSLLLRQLVDPLQCADFAESDLGQADDRHRPRFHRQVAPMCRSLPASPPFGRQE